VGSPGSQRRGWDLHSLQSSIAEQPCLHQYSAFIGVAASDEIRDMPTNYDLPTDLPFVSPSEAEIATDRDDLLSGEFTTDNSGLQSRGVFTSTVTSTSAYF